MRMIIAFVLFSLMANGQKSFSLDQCIALAKQHHPDVLLQNLNIARAENIHRQRLKSQAPSISGSVTTGLNGGRSIDPFSNSFVQRAISYNSIGVASNWTVFNGYSLRNQIRQDHEKSKAEHFQLEAVRKEITLAVIDAYRDIVINMGLIRLHKENIMELVENTEAVREQVKEGISASYSLTVAEAELANARFEKLNIENNYLLAKANLAQLIMIKEDFEVTVPTIPDFVLTPQSQGLHPTLQAWDMQLSSAKYGLAIARAERYPRISLNMGLGTSYSSGAVSEFTYLQQIGHNFNQFINLGLTFPIFSNGQVNSKIDAVTIEEKIVQKQRDKAEIQLVQQIETLKVELVSLKERLKSAEINEKAQINLYEVAKEKFREGLINQLELNTHRLNKEKAKSQYMQTQYELYFRNEVLKELLE